MTPLETLKPILETLEAMQRLYGHGDIKPECADAYALLSVTHAGDTKSITITDLDNLRALCASYEAASVVSVDPLKTFAIAVQEEITALRDDIRNTWESDLDRRSENIALRRELNAWYDAAKPIAEYIAISDTEYASVTNDSVVFVGSNGKLVRRGDLRAIRDLFENSARPMMSPEPEPINLVEPEGWKLSNAFRGPDHYMVVLINDDFRRFSVGLAKTFIEAWNTAIKNI